MNKIKVETKIGDKKLVFTADPSNEYDTKFMDEIRQVAAKNPNSIQEFFLKIAELQRSKQLKEVDEGMGKGPG